MESKAKVPGYPTHPILIVFPLGLLATSVLFSVIYLLTHDPSMSVVSYGMAVAGILGGLVAVPGLIDWLWAVSWLIVWAWVSIQVPVWMRPIRCPRSTYKSPSGRLANL